MARMRELLRTNAIGEPRAVSLSRTGPALLRAGVRAIRLAEVVAESTAVRRIVPV